MAHEIFATPPFDAFSVGDRQVNLHKKQIGQEWFVAWSTPDHGRYWKLEPGVEWAPDIDLFVRDDAITSLNGC